MDLLKRTSLGGIVLVVASALTLGGQEQPSRSPEQGKHQQTSLAASGRKPNIVLMLTDNLGYGAIHVGMRTETGGPSRTFTTRFSVRKPACDMANLYLSGAGKKKL
ncbi:MAG: hypothetical protein WA637_14550 [Terriglobales bacterium]